MFALFNLIEKQFYLLRDLLWDYPDLLLFGDNSLYTYLNKIYLLTRPYSHIGAAVVFSILLIMSAVITVDAQRRNPIATYIEGAVMGVDELGNMQSLDHVNPLVPSKFQLGQDINRLIYEPLFEINDEGKVVYKLATSAEPTVVNKAKKEGIDYTFKLRQDVYWHDGSKFTADDVVATFNKIIELGRSEITANKAKALEQMGIAVIDPYTLRIFVQQDPNSTQVKLFPNFLELCNFPILPAKYLIEIDASNVTNDSAINRRPIGTGPYRYETANSDEIILRQFNRYYLPNGQIKQIVFRLFKTEEGLINALKNGEIHSFASNTSRHIRDLERYNKIVQYDSNVLYQQYWALYFNLKSGPEYLKDINVRKALALAIDYRLLLRSILDRGERSYTTIPKSSAYFSQNTKWPEFNPESAKQLLFGAGWNYDTSNKFSKNGQRLVVNLQIANNYDREQVIESIRQDWEKIGITVNINTYRLNDLKEQHLIPRLFDVMLYGMNTFQDPDRYELFHTSAIEYPGLNISGWESSGSKTKTIIDKKIVDIARSDRALETGRGTVDSNFRKQEYKEFQEMLNKDQPVIFLYHPIYTYFVSRDVSGVKIDDSVGIEDRFNSIREWKFND